MADIRERDQPGTVPRPRRDGGGRGTRTGSPGGQDAGEDALAWSVAAMSGALRLIGDASGADVPQAAAAAAEAVWWVTVADAAITRHCPAAYRGALPSARHGARHQPYREYRTQLAGRPLTEALTLTGQVPSAHTETSCRAMPVQP